jgi:hypothetical protein
MLMRRLAIVVFAFFSFVMAGVVTTTASAETTTTETIERPSHERVVETEKETTETKESNGAHYGIISGTVHAVGWVLALPFRIVGGLIRLIF